MVNKTRMLKKAFHEACGRAIAQQLGQGWAEYGMVDVSWSACFQRASKNCIKVLRFQLVKSHPVLVELAVKSHSTDPMPRIGWEDRHKYPQSSGYFKLLWHNDVRYGREELIHVPKEFRGAEFQAAIETTFKDLRDRIESWFETAEVYMGRRLEKGEAWAGED